MSTNVGSSYIDNKKAKTNNNSQTGELNDNIPSLQDLLNLDAKGSLLPPISRGLYKGTPFVPKKPENGNGIFDLRSVSLPINHL